MILNYAEKNIALGTHIYLRFPIGYLMETMSSKLKSK